MSPIFAQNFYHGSKKKIKRYLLDIIFYFGGGFSIGHCHTLALVNVDFAFCNHLLCTGNGYYLNHSLGGLERLTRNWNFIIIANPAGFCRIFVLKNF